MAHANRLTTRCALTAVILVVATALIPTSIFAAQTDVAWSGISQWTRRQAVSSLVRNSRAHADG